MLNDGSLFAQEPPPAADSIEDKDRKPTLMKMLFDGNPFGLVIVVIILALSVASAYLIIVFATTITRARLMPEVVAQGGLDLVPPEGATFKVVAGVLFGRAVNPGVAGPGKTFSFLENVTDPERQARLGLQHNLPCRVC